MQFGWSRYQSIIIIDGKICLTYLLSRAPLGKATIIIFLRCCTFWPELKVKDSE